MYYVYVLRSLKSSKNYVGSTALEPGIRLTEHNNGKVHWTRSHRPLKLIYTQEFETKDLAQKRERYLKSGKGRATLKLLVE